jgi:hypothetical protein
MSSKKDPNKKHYFQVVAHDEFSQSILMQCKLDEAQLLTVWEKGEQEELAELYQAIDYNPNTKTLKLVPTGNLITKITGSLKSGKIVLIKIPIEDKIHYFTGGQLKFHPDDLTYSLNVQQEIYKSQQRGNFRLDASNVIQIQFKIDEQVFDGIDLSVGGTSFLINESEVSRFPKGKLFQDCTLRFDRKNYHIPMAQVAGIFQVSNLDNLSNIQKKVGIAFKGLSRKIEDELYIKITTEARGEEMKKKFDEILSKKA